MTTKRPSPRSPALTACSSLPTVLPSILPSTVTSRTVSRSSVLTENAPHSPNSVPAFGPAKLLFNSPVASSFAVEQDYRRHNPYRSHGLVAVVALKSQPASHSIPPIKHCVDVKSGPWIDRAKTAHVQGSRRRLSGRPINLDLHLAHVFERKKAGAATIRDQGRTEPASLRLDHKRHRVRLSAGEELQLPGARQNILYRAVALSAPSDRQGEDRDQCSPCYALEFPHDLPSQRSSITNVARMTVNGGGIMYRRGGVKMYHGLRRELVRVVHGRAPRAGRRALRAAGGGPRVGEWNGRLPPLMPAVGRVEVDPHGPTASKCQGGRFGVFPGKPEGPR